MLGTIVNVIAVMFGSALGLLLKGGIKERYSKIIMQVLGMSVIFIGATGAIKNMMDADAHAVLFVISMVIGSIIGEKLDLDDKLNRLGLLLQSKIGRGKGDFAKGFVSTSLLFCVGTMSVLGSIESGMNNNHSILFAKSILDGVGAVIFASSLGIGVFFSAFTVLLYQGALTMLSSVVAPYLTADMLREVAIVGGILIACLGVDMLEIKKMKVCNMLPSILIPIIYYVFIV